MLRHASPSALTAEISGKVWQFTTTDEKSVCNLKISNMHRDAKGVVLRVISDAKPHMDAVAVPPSLEDVFLYHCGEVEG